MTTPDFPDALTQPAPTQRPPASQAYKAAIKSAAPRKPNDQALAQLIQINRSARELCGWVRLFGLTVLFASLWLLVTVTAGPNTAAETVMPLIVIAALVALALFIRDEIRARR